MDSRGVVVKYTAGQLRQTMPTITAWLDDMRQAFGAETINAAIRGGVAGRPTFFAEEGGVSVGTPRPAAYGTCSADEYITLLRVEGTP